MKEQNQALKYVLSVVFLIWFFASLIALVVYGNRHDGAMVAIMFGQYFIVFGLIFLFVFSLFCCILLFLYFRVFGLAIFLLVFRLLLNM